MQSGIITEILMFTLIRVFQKYSDVFNNFNFNLSVININFGNAP